MNVIRAIQMYIDKMISDAGPGMKLLMMDRETISIVSMAFAQSEMLQKEVFLFERLDSVRSNEKLKYLKCIVFVRPTKDNVFLLQQELQSPKFGSYYIYFSNIIPRTDIKILAESDEGESVQDFKEIYADYLPVNPNLFSLHIPTCLQALSWNPEALERSTQGLVSVLLSFKFRPAIRYRSGSTAAQTLAKKVHETINKETALFSFRPPEDGAAPPLLLILDRRDDPITPLLNQWTYQAMVHELLTINKQRVDLSGVSGVPKDLKEVVLSTEQDEFYANNLYANFGEIATTIKVLMDEFQKKANDQRKIESIADMKNFVETYPQFRKMSGTVTKHLVLISELSVQVGQQQLFEVSELEQEIACRADHSTQLQRVKRLLSEGKISAANALRLVLLYAMRYERHANCDTSGLLKLLQDRGGRSYIAPRMLEYISTVARQELFNTVKLTDAVKLTRNLIKELKGVENVYAQHECVLKGTLEEVIKGRPLDAQYPIMGNEVPFRRPPAEVIVFIVGGATYEEALAVHRYNQEGYRIVLGGTTIHNSESFIEEVLAATVGVPFKHSRSLQQFHHAPAGTA
ncbi:vacuolar protein sorting-associated protein 45 [Anopheles maculipalpis]|uniref:vacuolar protein sorting-associated protein 45 n=1 Tax=Anopheles maculipalpis TaxID=1496333 RepID=UPI002158A2E9|nr:vacuolar protein sorting-associated protein 45 [Anopheles maculipalpis]XP_050069315.1 vacuolar protein sorting-associated protein 45 [Anopheles maculipalpis]